MPDTNDADEQKLWELSAFREAAIADLQKHEHVYEATEAALGRIAREHFPQMRNWESNQLRQLGNLVSRQALAFTRELGNIDTSATNGTEAKV